MNKKQTVPRDAAYKKIYGNACMVGAFLHTFLPQEIVQNLDLTTLQQISGEFVSKELRRFASDHVWTVKWKNSKNFILIIMEFQSCPDSKMPLRIMNYSHLLLSGIKNTGLVKSGEPLPEVISLVLYTGTENWHIPNDIDKVLDREIRFLNETMPVMESPVRKYYGLQCTFELVDFYSQNCGFLLQNRYNPACILIRLECAEYIDQVVEALKDMDHFADAHPEYDESRLDFYRWALAGPLRTYHKNITEGYVTTNS